LEADERIHYAVEHTEVVRSPRQKIGHLLFNQHILLFDHRVDGMGECGQRRQGDSSQAKIVTASYLVNLEGFSPNARRFIELMAERYPQEPGIFYTYKNEPKEMNIVSDPVEAIVEKITLRIDNQNDPLAAIVKVWKNFGMCRY